MSAGLLLLLMVLLCVFAVGLATIVLFLVNVLREWVPVVLRELELLEPREGTAPPDDEGYVIDVESRLAAARARERRSQAHAAETPAQARMRQWRQSGAAPQ